MNKSCVDISKKKTLSWQFIGWTLNQLTKWFDILDLTRQNFLLMVFQRTKSRRFSVQKFPNPASIDINLEVKSTSNDGNLTHWICVKIVLWVVTFSRPWLDLANFAHFELWLVFVKIVQIKLFLAQFLSDLIKFGMV